MSQNQLATRVTPRFIPTVQIRQPAKAAKSALYYDWMVDQLRGAGLVAPGLISGCRWTNLQDDFTDFDGVPGLPSKIKGAALTCDYKFESFSTRATNYTRTPSPQEKAWRDLDLAFYRVRADELAAQVKDEKDDAKLKELKAELADTTTILAELGDRGLGYLSTGYRMLETDASGISWDLHAPNIPVFLTCDIELERDRIFGFSVLRDAASEEQASFNFVVGFGNGFTQYALSMGDDGNASEFWHYRNMSAAARAKLVAEYETLLDFGRLTVADRKQLLEWDLKERGIRAAAKARAQGEKELTPTESAQVEALQKQASDLKESKHLTEAQENWRQKLEDQIWIERAQFKLQEESADLIGRRVDVTVQFLQSGYIVVRSGATEFRYENKRVTGLEPPQFHFCLPEKSRLSIQSDGGSFGFVLARPTWKPARLLSQPWESLSRLDPADFEQRISGALLSLTQTEGGKAWNYGCSATAQLVELKAPAGHQAGRYQLEISLATDGRYSPEIYYLGLYRPASLVESEGVALWSSEADANRNSGASRVIDTLLQDDKRRSRLVNVIIANGQNRANLPRQCGGKALDVMLIDRENGGALVPLVRHGFVGKDERGRIGEITTQSGFFTVPLHGSEVTLDVTGCEVFLNRKIEALVPADGMFPNDYVRGCCRDAELPTSLWSRIPAGDAGFSRVAPTRPGRYPHSKPSGGTTFLQAALDCVRNHCKGADFWSDGLGLLLDKFSVRDRPELAFGTPSTGTPVESHLCLRGEVKVTQDVSDYTTSATFIGAKNPLTGQRCSATVSIPQATDETFADSPYFIGYELPYVAEVDDSLRSDADCALAGRDYLHKTPQTPDGISCTHLEASFDYDPTVRAGDLVRMWDVKCLVDNLEFAALNSDSSGEDAGKLRAGVVVAENKVVLG